MSPGFLWTNFQQVDLSRNLEIFLLEFQIHLLSFKFGTFCVDFLKNSYEEDEWVGSGGVEDETMTLALQVGVAMLTDYFAGGGNTDAQ